MKKLLNRKVLLSLLALIIAVVTSLGIASPETLAPLADAVTAIINALTPADVAPVQ